MTKDRKEAIQYASACIMLASGIVLSFLSFFLSNYTIEDSVLWYFAQTILYAGSVFGLTMYVSSTRKAILSEVNARLSTLSTDTTKEEKEKEKEQK